MSTTPFPARPDDDAVRHLATTDRQAALSEVARHHRGRLLHLASSILRDPDLAGDVVQEVLIKAMHEPRFFDEGFQRGAWLYRVTRNLCLNMVRDRKRRGDILSGMDTPRSSAPDQVASVLDDQRHDLVQEALHHLSAHHRRILEERFYNDLSYAEIADVLDIKLGTVMSRLSRAKTALLRALDGAPVADW